ncbi:MAG: GAF domain-containing protein [Chloroflexi bacterium]|nr:GAF domain-containing protein [Chloroflexota bacterium]
METEKTFASLVNPRTVRLRWLTLLVLGGLHLIGNHFMRFNLGGLTALIGVAAVSQSLIAALASRVNRAPATGPRLLTTLLYTRITIDLLLFLVAIRVTGGIESPFLFLLVAYLFVIDLQAGPRVGLVASLSALAALGLNAFLEFSRVLPHLTIGLPLETEYSNPLFIYVTLVFIAVIVYLGLNNLRAVAEQLRGREASLSQTSAELAQRVGELVALREIGEQLTASLNLNQVLDTIGKSALKLIHADDVHIFLYDSETDRLEYGIAIWADEPNHRELTAPRAEGLTHAVAKSKEPLLIDDVAGHPLFPITAAPPWNTKSIGSFPLKKSDRVVGVMNVAFQASHVFTRDEQNLMNALADQAALAIGNASLYSQVERRARELTALYESTRRVAQFLPPAELLARALEAVLNVLEASIGIVWLKSEVNSELSIVAQQGLSFLALENARANPPALARRVFQTNTPIVLSQDDDPEMKTFQTFEDAQTIAAVPIASKDRVAGVLLVGHREAARVGPSDLTLLSAIGQQLAVALENTRLYDEANRRAEELGSLREIGLALTSTLDLHEQLRLLHTQVQRVIDPDTFFVGLYDEARQEVKIEMAVEEGWELRGFTLRMEAPGLTTWIVQTRKGLRVDDLEKERNQLPVRPRHETRPARSWLGVPMLIQDRVIGVLSVQSFKPNAFSASDERFLLAVGQQAALALENARLFATAAQRARELELLNEISRAISASLDLTDIFGKTVRGLADAFGYSHVSIYRCENEQLVLKTKIGYEHSPAGASNSALAERAAKSGQVAFGRVTRETNPPKAGAGVLKEIAAPIHRDAHVLGVLAIQVYGESELAEEDTKIITAFADHLGAAIANAELYQSVLERERLTRKDTESHLTQGGD